MPSNPQVVARQVERIVRQLHSLSTFPSVAADLLGRLNDSAAGPEALAEHIQADPALAAMVLSLAHQEGVRFSGGPSVAEAAAKLPAALLREALISVKVFDVLEGGESPDAQRPLPRREMALHALAAGCCADELAQCVLPEEQRTAAYLAGLLHDIGKYALDEVMPKSFARMVEQARSGSCCLIEIEQQHLGLDHALIGKRLAEKWFLPDAITAAIWLHHCDAQTLAADLPYGPIVRVAALADRLVRTAGIGHSGSYDTPQDIAELAQLLSLNSEQISRIADSLAETVSRRSRSLGLGGAAGSDRQYVSLIRKTAVHLAESNRKLAESTMEHRLLTAQAKLIGDFLDAIDQNALPADIAEAFAAAWQTHCQSGLTCVYVVPDATEPFVEAAVTDRQGRTDIKLLQMPDGIPPIPHSIQHQSAIQPAADAAKWILEQLECDFDPARMKMVSLSIGDQIPAVLVYEDFSPLREAARDSMVLLCCRIAAAAIAMAQAVRKNGEMAERFVQMMGTLRQARSELTRRQSLEGLAQMAAGAAHELNTPLAVISGRAQLLLTAEEDPDKKQMLRQIQQRTEEISQIISDLMAFAQPAAPQKRTVPIDELLRKAIDKTRMEAGLSALEITISGAEQAPPVYVDAHQVIQSLSYILMNALQSYKGGSGPIWIDCLAGSDERSAVVAIRDAGCGMDADTLAKAVQPFFSYRPAGRRRGMGLAHAQRLLLLNGGRLSLDSKPDKGTTVTIVLPKV
ncbi:MAG TPA: HDOD domain-containing protein [Anaerohalosphaeraceae bacterium]|nr:HDOD domain-containing protein [Anaerohalosphaeraceae bacterium]HOL31563.1 HDOD domain-containing protein [Anaerohalosphaeraceae bacterium]HOM75990.1 HDOD domain-containing protein [Anaerohalosphaeraceae bacterium]HPC63769.1 HDOD domain-containing protein [Anaerohalosphaeraceae bacterium]HPO69834.1 HDOD domain-containing protein [Anaerohalosphaeraceae bacterium]